MSFVLDDLTRQMVRVEQTVTSLTMARARPVSLRALGWQMIHLGRLLVNEAAKREGAPPPGRSQAERDADRLSWDATRDPDLTYRGV